MSRTVSCTVHADTGTPSGQSATDPGTGLQHPEYPHAPVLSPARPVLVRIMPLPVQTDPVELSTLRRRARCLVDTLSDLITHGQHTYAAFRARGRRSSGQGQRVGPLRGPLPAAGVGPRPPPPFNAPDIQAAFAAVTAPFGVHLLNRLHGHLQEDFGQLEDATMGDSQQGWRQAGRGRRRRVHTCFRCLHLKAPCQYCSHRLGPITTTTTITYSTPKWDMPRCTTISHTTTCTRLFRFRFTSITITMRTNMRLSNVFSSDSRVRLRRCRSTPCRLPPQCRW